MLNNLSYSPPMRYPNTVVEYKMVKCAVNFEYGYGDKEGVISIICQDKELTRNTIIASRFISLKEKPQNLRINLFRVGEKLVVIVSLKEHYINEFNGYEVAGSFIMDFPRLEDLFEWKHQNSGKKFLADFGRPLQAIRTKAKTVSDGEEGHHTEFKMRYSLIS